MWASSFLGLLVHQPFLIKCSEGGEGMRIKTLIIILLSFGLIFGGFYTYLKISQLDEPLFLTHFYEKEVFDSSDEHIPIFYITNQGDQRQLVSARSKEIPGHRFYVNQDVIHYSEGIYNQHKAFLTLRGISEKNIKLEDFLFEFSDGTSIEANIGAIKLLEANRPPEEEWAVNIASSGSSNTGESFASIDVLKDSRLSALTLPFTSQLTGILDVKLDNANSTFNTHSPKPEDFKIKKGFTENELPVSLKKSHLLRLYALVDKNELYTNDIHALQFGITGTFQVNGREVKQNLMHVMEQPYLTSAQIKELKDIREDGGK
jgi:hypothetical protein